MKYILTEAEVKVPEGVEVEIKSRNIRVKG